MPLGGGGFDYLSDLASQERMCCRGCLVGYFVCLFVSLNVAAVPPRTADAVHLISCSVQVSDSSWQWACVP